MAIVWRKRLPIRPGMSSAPPPTRAPVVSSARGRILVVDDEPLLRKLMVRILEGSHEVVTATSGAKAQVILQGDQSFDVILCDLIMPQLTGMDLHDELRQAARTEDLRIALRRYRSFFDRLLSV